MNLINKHLFFLPIIYMDYYLYIILLIILFTFYYVNQINEYYTKFTIQQLSISLSNNKIKKLELVDFKNIHNKKDIYIIGSGKSCDFIDNDFFKDKITIGVNQVYNKFNCNYYIRKEHAFIDDVIKKTKKSLLFVSRGDCGEDNNKNKDYIESNKIYDNKVIVFDHYKNCGSADNPNNIKKYNYTHFQKDKNKLISTSSTLLSGIHLAYYMGAKNIILVGHDCCKINGESNFKNYHTDKTLKLTWNNKDQYNNWVSKIESQTVHIKKILKNNYNVNVVSLNPFVSYNLEGNIKN